MEKSRNLNIVELYEKLQVEYLAAEIRKKIYPKQKDKLYYSRVMSGKKEKIENISIRNNLPSIFNSKEKYSKCVGKVYNERGLPNHLENEKDIVNYYMDDQPVKIFKSDNDFEIGKIIAVNLLNNLVTVENEDGEEIVKNLSEVTRIL